MMRPLPAFAPRSWTAAIIQAHRASPVLPYNQAMSSQAAPAAGDLPVLHGLHEPILEIMSHACTGHAEAIRQLAASPPGISAAIEHRVAPLLAILAYKTGIDVPEKWLGAMRQSATMRLLLESALSGLGDILDAAAIPWVPLKGMGLPARLYPSPECRPTSDVDVLIPEAQLSEARDNLRKAGWKDIHSGTAYEHFLLHEGYNWQASHPSGVMLELHFRLWGPVDPALPQTIIDAARPAPDLGVLARIPGPAESYIVTACHLWNSPQPVALMYFFDLHLLSQAGANRPAFAESVISMARRHDLQLFAGLAAAVTNQLWPDDTSRQIARGLLTHLRPAERAIVTLARYRSARDIPLGALVFARLLSGRKSRSGWRAPLRRVWPHPAIFQESSQKGPIATLRRTITRRH